MNKQSLIINHIGIIMGVIFLITGILGSSFFLGGLGVVFIVLSITPMGETSLRKWYMLPLFPIPSLIAYIAPKKAFWIVLIYGILACAAFVGLILFAPDLLQSWLRSK